MAVEKVSGPVSAWPASKRAQPTRFAWWQGVEQLASSRVVVYLLFTLLYVPPAVHLAHRKLLWDDEFFTLYLSKISSWHELLRALATGADQHPPTYYYLTHELFLLLGTSHLILRLPSIVGFGLLCLCLYEIVRLLATPLWGVVALLFPLGTNLYYYATEARGYGLVSGCMALAVLAWLKATSRSRRSLWLVTLGTALAGAMACHYYALMAASCLCLGELVRTRVHRRLDGAIWTAFACTLLPIAVLFKTIKSARGYSTHFWAVPVWSDAIRFYQVELAVMIAAVCGAVALFVMWRGSLSRTSANGVRRASEFWLPWEATALTALALLPLIVMVVAKFVTHGFADRYAICTVIGVTALVACALYRLEPAPAAALAAVLVCSILYFYQVHTMADTNEGTRARTSTDIARLSNVDQNKIVIMDITPFHQVSFYAPRSIASRAVYLSDPKASVRYLGHDTIDRGLLDLRPWFPIDVIPAGKFLQEDPSFSVYGAVNSWNWLTFDLPKWGSAQLLSRGKQNVLLFSVKGVHVDLPIQSDAGARDALVNQQAKDGASLCARWMGASDCM